MVTSGAMTTDEREAFLADVHVGVLAVDEPGRGPLAMPIWYQYVEGAVVLAMDGASLKARLLKAAGRATLTVQTETAPYQYVSVEGPVTIVPAQHDGLALATRYLGAEFGKWYNDANPTDASTVTVILQPQHWRTFDFAKLLA